MKLGRGNKRHYFFPFLAVGIILVVDAIIGIETYHLSWYFRTLPSFRESSPPDLRLSNMMKLSEKITWSERTSNGHVDPGTRIATNSQTLIIDPGSVLNPGFEMISEKEPKFWQVDPQGGWSVDTRELYQGEKSIQATLAWSWLSQEIPVKSERNYVLRAYVRSDMGILEKKDYYNTFLTLECLDKKNEIVQRNWGIVNATSSWELKENTIFVPPGTRKIRMKLAKRQGEGSVWFDEVELMEVPPGSVLNPGFEMISEKEPKFWQVDPQGGWSVDTRELYQGEKSIQATLAWSWLSQEIPVKSERNYVLRAYVRSDIPIPEKADYYNTFLTLECLDEKNRVIQRERGFVNATSSWQFKENTIFAPPGTRKVRINLAKRQGEESIWFDEVELGMSSASSPENVFGKFPHNYWLIVLSQVFFLWCLGLYKIGKYSVKRILVRVPLALLVQMAFLGTFHYLGLGPTKYPLSVFPVFWLLNSAVSSSWRILAVRISPMVSRAKLRLPVLARLKSCRKLLTSPRALYGAGRWFRKDLARIPIVGFMVLLVSCAVLLIFKREEGAEKVANIAYFLLVIGVGMELVFMLRHRGKESKDNA